MALLPPRYGRAAWEGLLGAGHPASLGPCAAVSLQPFLGHRLASAAEGGSLLLQTVVLPRWTPVKAGQRFFEVGTPPKQSFWR